MTVILYFDFWRKGEFKGNSGAEDPSDFRVTLDTCGDKRGVSIWNLQYKRHIGISCKCLFVYGVFYA